MPVDMGALSAAADAAVTHIKSEATPIDQIATGKAKSYTELSDIEPAKNPVKAVKAVGDAIMGTINIGADLTNVGVAAVTAPLSAAMPAFAAAHLGSLYVGIPHAHLHPPSLIPPAPVPVPLPSLGAITLGTSLGVLIGGMPAARVGDLGLAPTCGGLAPFFTVFLGSSKVFIGGTRAARQTDMCTACTPSTSGAARGVARAMEIASKTLAVAGIVSSVIDAGAAVDAEDHATSQADAAEHGAEASANAIGAAMGSAQMAADAAATSLSALMGTDPAVPPGMIGFITLGAANVVIGGVPMPNIPDPAQWLLKKLHAKVKGKFDKLRAKRAGGAGGCGK